MGFERFLDELMSLHAAGPARLPANLVVLPRIGSTNALGRRIAREYFAEAQSPPPVLLVAWEQTAGRGRRGRTWTSPPGRGVYASLLTPLPAADDLHTLPLLAAIGLCRAANRHLPGGGLRCRLKWPNDLLLIDDRGGRKLGGLLIESERGEEGTAAAVIGFGVNHRPAPEVEAEAAAGGRGGRVAALAAESPKPPSLAELVRDLGAAVVAELDHLGDETYAAREYQALSAHRPGDTLRCRDGERTVEGVFLGFDRRGFLRLRPVAGGGGELRLAAGEVLA